MKSAQIKLFLSDFEKSKCYYHNRKNDLINIKRNDKMKSVEVVIKAMIIGQNLQPSALPSLSVQELRSSFWVIRQMPG